MPTSESPPYRTPHLVYSSCRTKQERPGTRAPMTGGNTMSEYEIRSVGGHVEVYTRGGVFLFSADTVREAMEELDEAA